MRFFVFLFFMKIREINTSSQEKWPEKTNVQISGSCILCVDNFRMIAERSASWSFIRLRCRRCRRIRRIFISIMLFLWLCYFWSSYERVYVNLTREMVPSVEYISWAEQLSCSRQSVTFIIFSERKKNTIVCRQRMPFAIFTVY